MFNRVLLIYLGIWIWFGIEIYQGFEYARDTQGYIVRKYAWVCSWIILEYAWSCPKQNLKLLYMQSSICRYIKPAKHLKWSKKECPAKIITACTFFPNILQYVWQGSKYRRIFKYSRALNIPRIMNMSGFLTYHGSYYNEKCLTKLH